MCDLIINHLISFISSFSHQILFFLIKSNFLLSIRLTWCLSFRVTVWNAGRKWTYKTDSKILKDPSNYHQQKRETAGLNRERSSSCSDWEHPLLYTHILNSSATLCKLHCKHVWPLARSYVQIGPDWWVHQGKAWATPDILPT